MKILTVVGARPQFIKASTVSRAIKLLNATHSQQVSEVILHTGQHYDKNMSQVFFDELGIPEPKYNLGVGGGLHGDMTGKMLAGIEKVLIDEKPDALLVYGDTNSTLAGALAAAKLHIPVAHVEAGLRSFNRKMPEELNRILTDHASNWLFTPTEAATNQLSIEGIPSNQVIQVGDVMFDAALYFGEKCYAPTWFDNTVGHQHFCLATIHRAENTDNDSVLRAIFDGLGQVNELIVMPLHPRTANKINKLGINLANNIKIVEPVSYLEMVWLEKHSELIITDSGGVQKEAFFHRKPCITVRDETEWKELCDLGFNKLTSPSELLTSYRTMKNINLPFTQYHDKLYGDGKSAELIVSSLVDKLR
ncbi:UDP-N-acetylglucosamine 2-epimerase (non-hydrolyzing) [Saccharobesus litoralis]|uniref:UDP-N-acetylglucosamine 2-epimerase (Non-hydrolyzing) n=1 Tax=Saccharobesus litoralis TaxID=2172099 RepID=A0A2S0VXY0_9ALTE|nr:UDP-N-acetylglucosamine 2-epimerase (non-hydrolyzing) [Saccharobesus litoralis]